jgi:hypothetical protein
MGMVHSSPFLWARGRGNAVTRRWDPTTVRRPLPFPGSTSLPGVFITSGDTTVTRP